MISEELAELLEKYHSRIGGDDMENISYCVRNQDELELAAALTKIIEHNIDLCSNSDIEVIESYDGFDESPHSFEFREAAGRLRMHMRAGVSK